MEFYHQQNKFINVIKAPMKKGDFNRNTQNEKQIHRLANGLTWCNSMPLGAAWAY